MRLTFYGVCRRYAGSGYDRRRARRASLAHGRARRSPRTEFVRTIPDCGRTCVERRRSSEKYITFNTKRTLFGTEFSKKIRELPRIVLARLLERFNRHFGGIQRFHRRGCGGSFSDMSLSDKWAELNIGSASGRPQAGVPHRHGAEPANWSAPPARCRTRELECPTGTVANPQAGVAQRHGGESVAALPLVRRTAACLPTRCVAVMEVHTRARPRPLSRSHDSVRLHVE